MTTTNYVQLPPDGVGKAIRHRKLTDLVVNTNGYTTIPAPGITLTGASSGATGTLVGIYTTDTTNYYIENVSGTFTIGEVITNDTASANYADLTSATYNIYEPSVNITDPKTPEYALSVEKASGGRGAALVSFPEFAPQFDAFGHMQVSQMQAAGEYYHFGYDLAGAYYTDTAGSGAVVFNALASSMIYSTGTSGGDVARRVTNQYHPYKIGVSQLIYTSVTVGDVGVANCVREWGYFDEFSGFGFRLDGQQYGTGTYGLKVFIRNDSSGYPVDYEVPQDQWNVNTLISDSTSDMVGVLGAKKLDVSKSNLYWMDIQGTVGRVRLGVVTPEGKRIVCHQFNWTNTFGGGSVTTSNLKFAGNGAAYSQSGITWATQIRHLSLPLSWGIRNTGTVAPINTVANTMRVGAGVVFTESSDIKYTGVLTHITPPNPIRVTSSDNYQPVLNFKAKSKLYGPSISVIANNGGSPGLVVGSTYEIDVVGNTSWTSIGLPSGTQTSDIRPGLRFVYNGGSVGVTTGYVKQIINNSVIGIHETFDWASGGNVNLHIGIFVAPNDTYLHGVTWSETIDPETMLYVDQTATWMPNYVFWDSNGNPSPTATFSGNLSPSVLISYEGNVATCTSNLWVGSTPTAINGTVAKELYIGTNQYTPGVNWTSGSVPDKTRIVKQLTADATTKANTISVVSGAAQSTRWFIANITLALKPGQLVSGTGIPLGTTIESVNSTTGNVLITNFFTSAGSGTVSVFNPGGIGNYQVVAPPGSQTLGTTTMYGYYRFQPIESFIAPANSEGRTALGDRIEKSFGLGGNPNAPEDRKGVFIFGVKALGPVTSNGSNLPTLMYTKFWKEIR